jgi:glyoxylase-like metal-dependent hydrolase (beta-lactamase superfamily II)
MIITPLHAGWFKLDGGAMFGVVPRRMWAKLNPPDDQNLCTWAMRPLLVRHPNGRNIVIDTGIGSKQDEKFRSHFMPFGPENLLDSLQIAGLSRFDVTDVLLTHLHFDHCGGAIQHNAAGEPEPTFPNARYWSNERHWQWAMHPNERERASFLRENFEPLQTWGLLHFIPENPDFELVPGFRLRFYNGHTEALMAPEISLPTGQTLIYCADALPSQWHIGMPYVMAYDIRPLDTLTEKAALLKEAAEAGHILWLEHDPMAECAIVQSDERGKISLRWAGFWSDLEKN